MKKLIVGMGLVALIGLGAACTDTETQYVPVGSTGSVTDQDTTEVAADLAQASATDKQWADFCEGIDVLGYDLAFKYFADGYGSSGADAEAAFAELASRC